VLRSTAQPHVAAAPAVPAAVAAHVAAAAAHGAAVAAHAAAVVVPAGGSRHEEAAAPAAAAEVEAPSAMDMAAMRTAVNDGTGSRSPTEGTRGEAARPGGEQ
jgi:hypothetical protein